MLVGPVHVAIRLPGMIGFWILCLYLFRFVSIRTSPLAGYVAMSFPLVTNAYYYAYEARPYGAVMGFCGLALVCWQGATNRSERRNAWLVGLACALTGGMLTQLCSANNPGVPHPRRPLKAFPELAVFDPCLDIRVRRIDELP